MHNKLLFVARPVLSKSVGKGDSPRQMSLVIGQKMEVHDDLGAELVIDLSRVPRFDDVIQNLRRAVTDRRADDTRPAYFLTGAGRVLGSTSWIAVSPLNCVSFTAYA